MMACFGLLLCWVTQWFIFLEGSTDNALVVSVGGAKAHDFTYSFMCQHIFAAHPCVVLIQVGTNNVNKAVLNDGGTTTTTTEYASKSILKVFKELNKLQGGYSFVHGISGCVNTRSESINKKVDVINDLMRQEASKYHFHFKDNTNIRPSQLRDYVHLNVNGENILCKNLKGLI